MRARDIMTPHPAAVTPDEPTTRAAEIMHDLNVGIVPVVDDRTSMRLRGVLTDRDIVVRCLARHHDYCRIAAHLTGDQLATVRPETDVLDLIELMEERQVRRIPVVDDQNRLIGIVTLSDLAMRVGPQAPEALERLLERVSHPMPASTAGA